MCGIAGQVGRDPRTIQRRYAAYCAMQQTLARRGPDQRGMYICGAAALIHARLAVVDLENGLQPMQLDWQGESYVLVYNGELYNTPELRAALAARGHSFNGHSDTGTASTGTPTQRYCSTLLPSGAQTACPGATVFLRLLSGSRTQVRCFWRVTAAASSRCSTRRRRTR